MGELQRALELEAAWQILRRYPSLRSDDWRRAYLTTLTRRSLHGLVGRTLKLAPTWRFT
jgi:hypothetical protein